MMDNEKSKNLCMKFYKEETADGIEQLLKDNKMDNEKNWQIYGRTEELKLESNRGIIENQSSTASSSFIEKITNAIDAVLTLLCYIMGINPKSEKAPKTSKELLSRYLDIEEENLVNPNEEEQKKLDKLSSTVMVVATSENGKIGNQFKNEKKHINLITIDNGEGQSPKNLPRSILSLIRGNKEGICFTQGEYNQGGSACLPYCENGLCIVISKRNPEINSKFNGENDDSINQWGWTIIKTCDTEHGDHIYKYFAPNGQVPRFYADELPLKPKKLGKEESRKYLELNDKQSEIGYKPYEESMKSGTAIKLINYNLPDKGGLASHNRYLLFDKCIFSTPFPIQVIDCRKNKFNNSFFVSGLKNKLDVLCNEKIDEEKKIIENGFPITGDFKVKNQEVEFKIYAFKERGKNKLGIDQFSEVDGRIRLVVGQQFQGTISKAIFSSTGLSAIKDSLLIILQFPNITSTFKSELFKPDRERLNIDSEAYKELYKKLKSCLENNPKLKELNSNKLSVIKESSNSDKKINDLMENWINSNPEIKNILQVGKGIKVDENNKNGNDDEPGDEAKNGEVKTNYIPTYFKLRMKNKYGINNRKVIKSKSFNIGFYTDAPSDFWSRTDDTGFIKVKLNYKDITDDIIKTDPKNGEVEITLKGITISSTKTVIITVDVIINNEILFQNKIIAEIVDDYKKSNNSKTEKKEEYKLPTPRIVTKNLWSSVSMNEYSAIHYINGDYYVNIDNKYLQERLNKANISEEEVERCKNLFLYDLFFRAASINHWYSNKNKKIHENKEELEDEFNKESDDNEKAEIEEKIKEITSIEAVTLFLEDELINFIRKC